MRYIFFFSLTLIFTYASCAKDEDSKSSNSSTVTSSDNTSSKSIIIFRNSSGSNGGHRLYLDSGCYGTDSNGWTRAPFISTSNYNLKDRLPTSYHSASVYSNQGWKISNSWTELWDGNIDKTLFNAEADGDNETAVSNTGTGWWSGTKPDGTFSGFSCRDWTMTSAYGTAGSTNIKDNSSWIATIDNAECGNVRNTYCFKYK